MATPVEHLESVDSTNAEAMRRIAGAERGPRWLLARTQTGGRGRAGRGWVSPPGNHYASLILPLDVPMGQLAQVALVAGLAVYEAIVAAGGGAAPEGLQLKWPNDVLVGRAKLAGILAESTTDSWRGRGVIAVIGIGINLVSAPAHLSREVTALRDFGLDIDPPALLRHVDAAMLRALALWDNGRGFAAVRAAWLARGMPAGSAMAINTGREIVAGTFKGLDSDGALLLTGPSGEARRFDFGDVSLT